MFGVYSSVGKQLGSSDYAGNFDFCRRSGLDMVEKIEKRGGTVSQQNLCTALSLCPFLCGPVLWPCLPKKRVSQSASTKETYIIWCVNKTELQFSNRVTVGHSISNFTYLTRFTFTDKFACVMHVSTIYFPLPDMSCCGSGLLK